MWTSLLLAAFVLVKQPCTVMGPDQNAIGSGRITYTNETDFQAGVWTLDCQGQTVPMGFAYTWTYANTGMGCNPAEGVWTLEWEERVSADGWARLRCRAVGPRH